MPTIPHKPFKSLASMRKIALGTWANPSDPSANIQMDFNISELDKYFGDELGRYLKCYVIKACSSVLHDIPSLNTVLIRGKLRQRTNNRVFIPTMFRYEKMIDLNGISIDDAYKLPFDELLSIWKNKLSDIRSGMNKPVKNAIRIFNFLPQRLCKPVVKLIGFFQYFCNISMKRFGMPDDPFGSITITFLDKFNIRYGNIPIFSFSKSAIVLAVGTPYKEEGNLMLPITCTFDHRLFDGYDGNMAYKKMANYFKSPEKIVEKSLPSFSKYSRKKEMALNSI